MLWAAFCLAFYGFLRASEFTSTHPHSYQPDMVLRREDLQLSPASISILIKCSKTDPFR